MLCGIGIDDVGLWQCEEWQVVCCELAELWLLLYVGGLCKEWCHEGEVYAESACEVDEVLPLCGEGQQLLYKVGFVLCCGLSGALFEGEARRVLYAGGLCPEGHFGGHAAAAFFLLEYVCCVGHVVGGKVKGKGVLGMGMGLMGDIGLDGHIRHNGHNRHIRHNIRR